MQLDHAQKLVAGIKYKPGYKLELVYKPHLRTQYFEIELNPEDSKGLITGPHMTLTLLFTWELSLDCISVCDEQGMKAWIYDRIIESEVHEAEEWMKFNGVQYRDPHAND